MIKNPLTEERQQQLQERSEEFLKSFGKNYGINFGRALFEKCIEDAQPEEKPAKARKLKHRPWLKVERNELKKGFMYVKAGKGQGDFGGWKKYYVVETKDYNLDYYDNDKAYTGGKKPKGTVRMAGYSVESNTRKFYQDQWDKLKESLGASDEVTAPVGYSRLSWALTHPFRQNYIFQLHKGASPTCGCFGGNAVEPDDAGAEYEEEANGWIDAMTTCTEKAEDRDHDSTKGRAFDMTCESMMNEMENLSDFSSEGKEAEVLVAMLILQVVEPLKNEMLTDMQEIPMFTAKIKMTFTVASTLNSILVKLVDPAWTQADKGADKIAETLEPKLTESLAKFIEIKNNIMDKIKTKFVDKIGGMLKKHVSPYLKEGMNIFDKPLEDGFAEVKRIFNEKVVPQLQGDQKKISLTLDAIPRTLSTVSFMVSCSQNLVQPLQVLVNAHPDIFSHVDPAKIRAMTETAFLLTLDASIYTLEDKMAESGAGDMNVLQSAVTADLDHDIQIEKNIIMREAFTMLFIDGIKKLIFEESPVADLLEMIPEEVQNFIPVQGLLEEIVDLIVGEPILQTIDGSYPLPKGQ